MACSFVLDLPVSPLRDWCPERRLSGESGLRLRLSGEAVLRLRCLGEGVLDFFRDGSLPDFSNLASLYLMELSLSESLVDETGD